jgi:hypothetical protein
LFRVTLDASNQTNNAAAKNRGGIDYRTLLITPPTRPVWFRTDFSYSPLKTATSVEVFSPSWRCHSAAKGRFFGTFVSLYLSCFKLRRATPMQKQAPPQVTPRPKTIINTADVSILALLSTQ